MSMVDLQYPIGPFSLASLEFSPELRQQRIELIRTFPRRFREALDGIQERELEQPYRPGGWTIRQVVHHVPDSHMNAYVRFKWTLSEDTPMIKPYDQEAWANLPDTKGPIAVSLALLDSLHERWVALLHGMTDADFTRVFLHPEHDGRISLDAALANYAWHGDHHLAHVKLARASATE
jgi:hypothetical protein